MKIVLINPNSPFMLDQGVMPPLGLWYIAGALKDHDVEIVDMGLGDIIPKNADVYGITGTSVHIPQIKEIYSEIRNEKGLKVIGGHHATLMPQEMLKIGFDTVVCGEGDEIIDKVVKEQLTGIIYASRIDNLDKYFPDRSQEYRYKYKIDDVPAVTMVTSRGCPHRCAFCSKEINGRRRITRSAESVIQEVDEVIQMGYGAIMFYDETFMTNKGRLMKLCKAFSERKLIWRALARANNANNEELLSLMVDSGCKELGIGIESGSQTILDNIQKDITVEQNRQCIKVAHNVGMSIKAFMVVGLPGESWDTIAETDKFLEETQPDALDISILGVYPGSVIYQHPENYDVKFGTPKHYKGRQDAYVCDISTSHMTSDEIMQAQKMLYEKYTR